MADHRNEAHPFWAPAHNKEERWQETEAAREADRQRRDWERQVLALARRHRLTGDQARRFLERQRASRQRQQEAQAREQVRLGSAAQVLCCGRWWPIVQMPLRVGCCNKVYLAWQEDGRHGA